jgi:hypothetical protein
VATAGAGQDTREEKNQGHQKPDCSDDAQEQALVEFGLSRVLIRYVHGANRMAVAMIFLMAIGMPVSSVPIPGSIAGRGLHAGPRAMAPAPFGANIGFPSGSSSLSFSAHIILSLAWVNHIPDAPAEQGGKDQRKEYEYHPHGEAPVTIYANAGAIHITPVFLHIATVAQPGSLSREFLNET